MSTFTGFHTNSRFGFFPPKGSLFIMHCNVVTKYTIARGVFEYKGICPGLIRAMNIFYLLWNYYNFSYALL